MPPRIGIDVDGNGRSLYPVKGGMMEMEKDIESEFNACMFREYCRSLKAKFQAAEEMGRAVKKFVDYYVGSKKSHLGNGQAYKSHTEMEAALSAWERARKETK